MKNKYEFHEDLKKYKNFNVPINSFVVYMSKFFLGLLFKFQISNKKVKVNKYKIKSFDGKNVSFLSYTPKNNSLSDKCIYFIHGGGFVFNSAPHHYALAKNMAINCNCKVILVNYRLAPKYKFPYATNDVFEVYKWIVNNGNLLNINVNKIVVMGDSAGGNLSLATSLKAYENNIVIPYKQVLLYPCTLKDVKTKSNTTFIDTPMCNSKDMNKYGTYYFINDNKENLKYMAPYFSNFFENYPKTYIEVAEYDCLKDDGVMMYEKLKENNVDVRIYEIKKAMHGYDIAINTPLLKSLIDQRVLFINDD